ncbi:zinc finger BED domain-containing protein 4-like [Belonocnema kinseyi]|uniref:zinc finger BED domain-containing protein 4-like n=1 Tax=Belonocnema kinseyi TaxID=2817044 RepID=UPI00143D70BD|nr:zinc finger BED domain-containing protein 4-like [Belonocnema kinseyi]
MQEEVEECDNALTLFSKHVWGINHLRAKELHYAIAEMIAVDNEPISFVEKAGFERLMSKTSPNYKVPCRKYFTKTILPDMYSRVKEVVKTMLSTVKWMSLTSDVWTCIETRYSFISSTAHWIGDNFQRKSAALSIKVFPGRHMGEAIRKINRTIVILGYR